MALTPHFFADTAHCTLKVEDILDDRTKARRKELLITWAGFDESVYFVPMHALVNVHSIPNRITHGNHYPK